MRTQARGEPVPADTTPYGRFCSGKWPRSSSGTQLVAVGAAAENARTGRSCTTAGRPRRQRSPDLISTPLATSTQSCAADSRRSGAILSRSSLNLVQACRSRPRPAPPPASRQAGRVGRLCGPVGHHDRATRGIGTTGMQLGHSAVQRPDRRFYGSCSELSELTVASVLYEYSAVDCRIDRRACLGDP